MGQITTGNNADMLHDLRQGFKQHMLQPTPDHAQNDEHSNDNCP